MPTSNNSFNLPLNDGQLIIGSTGVAPVAANITGSGGITVTNGPGTVNIAGSGAGLSLVNITASPPGVGNQLVISPNTLYNVGNNTSGFNAEFVLPYPSGPVSATIGDQFIVASHGPTGAITVVGNVPFPTLMAYRATSPITGTFVSNQTGFIWLMYVGIISGTYTYQILSVDNVVLT